MDHLPLGAHVGDVKAHGALHAVQIVVEAGAPVHEQGGGDTVEVQPEGEAALEVLVDELNGPLEFVVGQGHFVAGGDGELAHVIKPVLYSDYAGEGLQLPKTEAEAAEGLLFA